MTEPQTTINLPTGDGSKSLEGIELIKHEEGGAKLGLKIEIPVSDPKEEKNKRMRIKVLEEIVTTEQAYLQDLNFILKHFVVPCRKLISEEDLNLIFSNVATIQSVHQTIYASLSERVWGTSMLATPQPLSASASASSLPLHVQDEKESGNDNASPRSIPPPPPPATVLKVETDFMIADIFVKNADYLKFYTTYTLNQSESLQAIRRLKQNSVTFNAFLRGMQNKKTDIGSYLIKPVQRICKYPLLLRELLKYTPGSHPDYEHLQLALDKVQAVATHVDVHNQRVQNVAKMMEIQRSLVIGKGHKFDVVKPSRVFIQEGDFISIKPGTQKPGKTVRAFLFNDTLVITRKGKEIKGETKVDETGQAVSGASYTFQMRFSLKLTQVSEDKPGLAHAFGLLQPQISGKKVKGSLKGSTAIVLQASSASEKEQWVAAITKCKKEIQAKIMAQIQATSESKKGRSSTSFVQMHYKDDDTSAFDDDTASSEASYSPRDSPRLTRSANSSMEVIEENTVSTPTPKSGGNEVVVQKNPLLSVPGGSRSLPTSPASTARRRSSSYSQIAITPQILQREREKEKEEREREKEKEKKRKEKKEKKKKKRSVEEGDEPVTMESTKKKITRRDLFQDDDGSGGSGEEQPKKVNPKHLKDRARSRSFNQLPPLNKIDLKSSEAASPSTSAPAATASATTPTTTSHSVGEALKGKPIAIKRKESSERLLQPATPTRRKSVTMQELELSSDEDEEDVVTQLRMKLAKERLKKDKWKEKYAALRVRYDELEAKIARERNIEVLNHANEAAAAGAAAASGGEEKSRKASPREEALENVAKALSNLAAESTELQEKDMQSLLAQRKNELEEKKRLLESKRKELEEKRRETGLDSES